MTQNMENLGLWFLTSWEEITLLHLYQDPGIPVTFCSFHPDDNPWVSMATVIIQSKQEPQYTSRMLLKCKQAPSIST